jgi:hypothetical protein
MLWRESTSVINDELLKGYKQKGGKINEFIAGYISILLASIFGLFAFVMDLHSSEILACDFLIPSEKLSLKI